MSTEAVEFDMKKGEEVNVNMGLEMSKRKLKKLKRGKVEKERKTVHCIHWLKDKKRYCRLQRMKEFNLCAEHLPMDPCGRDELSCGRVRVKCPYPPNHTCFESQLKSHMERCNHRPVEQPHYIERDVNVIDAHGGSQYFFDGEQVHEKPLNPDYSCSYTNELTDAEYSDLIRFVVSLHQGSVPDMRERFGVHPVVGRELVRSDIGSDAAKHLAQIGSILNLLEEDGLLQDGTCFIEYGSGRGTLTYKIAQAVLEKGLKDCSFILVDLTSPRHKHDNKLKDSGLKIHRVRANIKDLVVAGLPGIDSVETKHIVGVAKHICGNAADMALYSLFDKSNKAIEKVSGAVIATCCHHRCESTTYIGREFVKKKFTAGDFHIFSHIGSWGIDGHTEARIDQIRSIKEDHRRFYSFLIKFVPKLYLRKTIGEFVKQSIDYGRAKFIEKFDGGRFFAETVKFVDSVTTLENTAIVVSKMNPHHKELRKKEEIQVLKRIQDLKKMLIDAGDMTDFGDIY